MPRRKVALSASLLVCRVLRVLVLASALGACGCKSQQGSGEAVAARLYVAPAKPSQVTHEQVEGAAGVVAQRVAVLTGGRPEVRTEDKVVVVDGLSLEDATKVEDACARPGMLSFALVPPSYLPASPDAEPLAGWIDTETQSAVDEAAVLDESEVLFRSDDLVRRSSVEQDEDGTWRVRFRVRADVPVRDMTAANVGRRMVIACDDEVLVAPYIRSPIPGEGLISDIPTQKEAEALQAIIESGPLPYEVRTSVEPVFKVGPGPQ